MPTMGRLEFSNLWQSESERVFWQSVFTVRCSHGDAAKDAATYADAAIALARDRQDPRHALEGDMQGPRTGKIRMLMGRFHWDTHPKLMQFQREMLRLLDDIDNRKNPR